MDRIIPAQERVSEQEEVLLVGHDGQSADRAVLLFRGIKNVVTSVHNVPVLIKHELKLFKFGSLRALEGEEAVLNLELLNAELPN